MTVLTHEHKKIVVDPGFVVDPVHYWP